MRGNKYAVLICGDVATHWGFDEFWGDVVLMREVLLKNGFLPEHVFVLYGDGVDFSHPSRTNPRYIPSTPITNFAATTTNVQTVMNGLASGDPIHGIPQMTADDFLYVWTFDHGSSAGGHSYLCLRDANMIDSDFAALLGGITYSYRVICMQQCFSGGFVPHLSNDQTVVLTACSANETAGRADDSPTTENEVYGGVTYHHGEFNFHLFSGLVWERILYTNVAVDTNLDRFASMAEVFDFVQSNDSLTETPQYDDGTDNIGQWLSLERDVMVFIRDNVADVGTTPTASPWWDSPDLWVRNADDNGTTHQNPIAGQTNWVHARIYNTGITRSGPLTVKFFYAGFSGTEFVYPTDYDNLITWAEVEGIDPGGSAIVKGPWIASEIGAAPSHPCLLAEVYDHSGVPSAQDYVWESSRLAQKNLSIVHVLAGQTLHLPVMVGSAVVHQTRPMVKVVLVEGEPDLETWIEVRDAPWLELLERQRAAEVRAPMSLTVEGTARLRMGFSGASEEPRSVMLDLADGSSIALTGEEAMTSYAPTTAVALEETTRTRARAAIDLRNALPVVLPPLLKRRQTLMLCAKVPDRARPGTRWVLDLVRQDQEARVAGGVRAEITVRG